MGGVVGLGTGLKRERGFEDGEGKCVDGGGGGGFDVKCHLLGTFLVQWGLR